MWIGMHNLVSDLLNHTRKKSSVSDFLNLAQKLTLSLIKLDNYYERHSCVS